MNEKLDKRFKLVSKSSNFNKSKKLEREMPTLSNVGHSFTQQTRYFESLKPPFITSEKYDLIGKN